ncbi:hypothetical protein F5H01DRAFT_346981 [Linnemannia elongata]|nr:hypothetical protein F5H01DRAFT_346981 [Linnemannia elongata]
MVDFGTTQPPKYSASASSASIRQRRPTTTTTSTSSTRSNSPSPLLSQLDTPQPPESPLPSHEQVREGGEEGNAGKASFSTLLSTYALLPLRRLSILVLVLSLLWISLSFWLSIACESDFKIVEDVAGQDQPLNVASEGSSSFSSSPSSLSKTEAPDFIYLIKRQAAMFEAFSQFLSSLNTPIILDDKSSDSYTDHESNINNGDCRDDTDQVAEQDSYGLEARTAASGKEFLPLYMSMKMSELAVIDLKVAVKHSLLPDETRALLVDHLGDFQMAAKVHTRKLQFLEARNKGWVEGVIARNVFLGAELKRLEGMSAKRYVAWARLCKFFCVSHRNDHRLHARKVTSVEKKLDRLFFNALKEDRGQLRKTILQVQELQQSLDAMDQTRQTLQDILGSERGHQEQLQRDIMAYVWTHLGGHQFEQETYRKNLALLKSMNKQQKRTGGHLQWILLELTEFEAELELLWERIVDAGVFEAQEGAGRGQSQGQRKGQGSAKKANGKKKTISLQDEIDQIETVTNSLKARKVPVF